MSFTSKVSRTLCIRSRSRHVGSPKFCTLDTCSESKRCDRKQVSCRAFSKGKAQLVSDLCVLLYHYKKPSNLLLFVAWNIKPAPHSPSSACFALHSRISGVWCWEYTPKVTLNGCGNSFIWAPSYVDLQWKFLRIRFKDLIITRTY